MVRSDRLTPCITAAIMLLSCSALAQQALSPWPAGHGTSLNAGYTPITIRAVAPVWKYSASGGGNATGVVLDSAGTIYSLHKGGLLALSPDGKKLWNFSAPYASGSAAVGKDGTICFSTEPVKGGIPAIYAVNPDGSQRWVYRMLAPGYCRTPVFDDLGNVCAMYTEARENSWQYTGLLSLNGDTGDENWKHLDPKNVERMGTTLCAGRDNTVYSSYYADKRWKIAAYDPAGTELWAVDLHGCTSQAGPAVGQDGTLYIGTLDSTGKIADDSSPERAKLQAVTPDGKIKWAVPIGSGVGGDPAVTPDGRVYCISKDRTLWAYTVSGKLIWKAELKELGDVAGASPVVDKMGTIYFGAEGAEPGQYWLVMFSPDGTEKGRIAVPFASRFVAIGREGQVYAGAGVLVSCIGVPKPASLSARPQR